MTGRRTLTVKDPLISATSAVANTYSTVFNRNTNRISFLVYNPAQNANSILLKFAGKTNPFIEIQPGQRYKETFQEGVCSLEIQISSNGTNVSFLACEYE